MVSIIVFVKLWTNNIKTNNSVVYRKVGKLLSDGKSTGTGDLCSEGVTESGLGSGTKKRVGEEGQRGTSNRSSLYCLLAYISIVC